MSQPPLNAPAEQPLNCSSSPIGRREFRSLVLNYLAFVCSAGLILLLLLSLFFICYLFTSSITGYTDLSDVESQIFFST